MRYRSAIASALLPLLVPFSSMAQTAVSPSPFTDISSSQNATAINSLYEQKILQGYDDGTFKPDIQINRAEFLKIVLEGRGKEFTVKSTSCFPDVNSEWFAPYVCAAKDEGIIGGYPDGTFKPDQNINFVEASKIVALAFDQDVQSGNSWYQGYIEALEGSKAIPLSIASLEQNISRGEMAEIMWRLIDNKTDQPSKSYFNVKYPEVAVNLNADTPQRASSCSDLKAIMQESNVSYGYEVMEDAIAMPMATAGAPAPAMRAQEQSTADTKDYSTTNIQVEGVDEADIIKTDGDYLYIIRQNAVSIVSVSDPTDLQLVSTVNLDADNFNPQELFIQDDRLIILGTSWKTMEVGSTGNRTAASLIWRGPSYGSQRSEVHIVDVSTAASPTVERTLTFEGNTVSSRLIGDTMYLVMNKGLGWNMPVPLAEVTDNKILPMYSDSRLAAADLPVGDCNDVMILPRPKSASYIMVAAIPVSEPNEEATVETVVGSAENIYMSLQNLFVATTDWQYNWRGGSNDRTTSIHRFAVSDDGLTYSASGKVPGNILNQFSMDEHNGMFRIATTVGDVWNTENLSTNNLFILNQDLDVVGSIEDIAPGERIYSVRFMGDRAYMVTFKKVDPFFVIDVSNPRNPAILGKLKIPGYSDYLHPYDENHILGFGKEAVEAKEGDFAWYQGLKIALFDVSDVANPIEKHKVVIGDRGSDSELLHNHKALLFEKDRNLLAFPVTVAEIPAEQKKPGSEANAYGQVVFQGAQVYELTLADGFELIGDISHYTAADMQKSGSYLYGKQIQRIIRTDNSLLTISPVGVQSHTASDVRQQDSLLYEKETASDGNCPTDSEDFYYVSNDPDTCSTIRYTCPDNMTAFSGSCGCGCK